MKEITSKEMSFREAIDALRKAADYIEEELKDNPKATLDSLSDEIRTVARINGEDYHLRISKNELRDEGKLALRVNYDRKTKTYRCGMCDQVIPIDVEKSHER